jgi:asparagine synthase (glutamine-hydrolysing)
MCGISGIINLKGDDVDVISLKEMNDLIMHRGPDDEGFFVENNIALGHRRLAIIDVSYEGHQPMFYDDELVIVFNGEIYNYIEIKEELLNMGYLFNTQTDTEVILAAYKEWGHDCVNHFNGMWAFSIFNKEKNIIFCSRDRFGIKPFYYTEIDNTFVFGSEIKQLLEFYPNRYINKKILMDYLVIGFEEHINETFFENIFKLEQSHNLTYDLNTNTYDIKRYYDIELDENTKKLNLEESINIYSDKLKNAIKLRLRSDVKVGACLSGGLDSSSIASIASNLYHKISKDKFVAIHAKSTEIISDESIYAKEVSEYCNLDLKTIEPTEEDFLNSIDEVIYTQEEPFGGPSIFMQYFVMKKANEVGCTVLLDGQGGDETLVGYERYYPAYLMSLSCFDFIKAFFNSSLNSKLTKKELFAYFIYFTQSKIRIKRLISKNKFIKKKYFDLASFDILEKNARSYFNLFDLQREEIFHTQMPHLLRYEDKNSMRNSIETRLPFIDFRVVEAVLSINSQYKIKNGWTKYILRKSVDKILPENIAWRKNKFGFEAPEKTWLKSIETEIQESIKNSNILNEVAYKIEFNSLNEIQKWKLFNIAKWEEIYNVSWKEK